MVISQLKTEHAELFVQHMKAAKALLVIIPLLGLTQVITIYGHDVDPNSTEKRSYTSSIYLYTRALLLSTQVTLHIWSRKLDTPLEFFLILAWVTRNSLNILGIGYNITILLLAHGSTCNFTPKFWALENESKCWKKIKPDNQNGACWRWQCCS